MFCYICNFDRDIFPFKTNYMNTVIGKKKCSKCNQMVIIAYLFYRLLI